MEIELPYEGEYIRIDVPLPEENITILRSKDPSPTNELKEVVRNALTEPVGKERLSEIVQPGDRVVVMFDDFTRPTPVAGIVPLVLDELKGGGVRDEDIVLICGNGMHAPDYMARDRLIEKLGQDVFEKYRVMSHDAYDYEKLKFIGVTRRLGTPLWINGHVAQADVKVALGRIAPHIDIGYSGGAKMIMPGVSSVWSIIHNHSGLSPRTGVLHNPLREDIDECGRLVGLDFILNVVHNSKNRVLKAFAGDQFAAHRKGIEYGDREVWGARVSDKADILIMSPGLRGEGYFKSAIGCLGLVHTCLKEKGTIIIIASCYRGWAEQQLIESGWTVNEGILKYDYEELLRMVASRSWHESHRQFQALAGWVQNIVKTCFENNVVLAGLKGFRREDAARMNLEVNENIDKAIVGVASRYGGNAKAIVIPDRFTLPLMRNREID